MTAQITVIDARWLAEKGAGVHPADGTVWYFGDDHALYMALRQVLPENLAWGDAGGRLNAISLAHQRALIDIEQLFSIDDTAWWEWRNIAERGPYSTSFTADCCRYLLFCDLLNQGGHQIFIVENPELDDLLRKEAGRRQVKCRHAGPGSLRRHAANARGHTRRIAGFARAAWRRWRQVRHLARLRRAHPIPFDAIRECDVLFAAWTRAGDFPETGKRDLAHSMGLLPKILRDRGFKVGFIALPLDEISDPMAIAKSAVRSEEAVILPDDTIGASEILSACMKSLSLRARPAAGAAIGDCAVEDVARMTLSRERFDWRAANAALWSRIGPFLATHGCRPKAVFHVYENQTWEKGLRQGLRKALADSRIVGCQQSPFSDLYLNIPPATFERPPERWPDAVLSHGARCTRQLTGAGAPKGAVVEGGLLRSNAFLREPQTARTRGTGRRVVCATGPGYQESLEIARKAAGAVMARPEITLVINFHPITVDEFRNSIRRFVANCGVMADNVEFSYQPINDLFDLGVDAVIYADTNAGFEAVSSGARAINILSDHALSFDKLPDGLARRVRSVDEIRSALDEIDDDDKWPSEEFIKETLADCFSAIDLEAIMGAAGLTASGSAVPEFQTNGIAPS